MTRPFRSRAVGRTVASEDQEPTTRDGSRPMTTISNLPTRRLGATGPTVSMIGLGAMGMSGSYGARDEEVSVATIRAAVDAGVTLIDTGDFYGFGHNEMLIGRALRVLDRSAVQLSVKFGMQRGVNGSLSGVDTRPIAMRT